MTTHGTVSVVETRDSGKYEPGIDWGFRIFGWLCFAGCVAMVAFGIWYPATHTSKRERIERLEQRVDQLELQMRQTR